MKKSQNNSYPILYKPSEKKFEIGNSTVTICHSKTKSLKEHTIKADILIAATGVANLITSDMVNEHVDIIDIGINRVEDDSERGYHISGDVDFQECVKKVLHFP